MKKKIILFLILLVCSIGAGHLAIEYVRKDNSEKYHATAACEDAELNYCKETFEIGITYANFKKTLQQKDLEIFFSWEKEQTKFLELRHILKECPKSGRNYCGITFAFKNNTLDSIYSGNPCH